MPLDSLIAVAYPLFYTLAVAIAGLVMFDTGRRRGWAPGPWAMAVTAWLGAGVLGAMLPHLLLGEAVAPRTSIGAIAFSTLALAIIAPALRRSVSDVLDTSAVAIPLGAAVVRIGCFVAECCRGVVTALPVGIALHPEDEIRHATQLYEAGLEAFLALAITRRATASRPGARFLVSIAAMSSIRFVTEFVRDNEKYGGLSLAQWIVLPLALACLVAVVRRASSIPRPRAVGAMTLKPAIAIGAALGALLFVVELPPLEETTLLILLGVALATAARRISRAAPAGATLLALQMPPLSADSTYPRSFTFFGGGFTAGSFERFHKAGTCDGPTEEWNRSHSFRGFAAEVGGYRERTHTRGGGYRARGYYGTTSVGAANIVLGTPTRPGPHSRRDMGLTLVGDLDWKYLGLSGGGSFGSFHPMGRSSESGSPDDDAVPFMPAFGLRLGPKIGLSGEVRFGDEAPTSSPGPTATATLAFGGRTARVRAGTSDVGPFVAGRYMTPWGLEVLPSVNTAPRSDHGVGNVMQGSIMLRKWVRVSDRR